MKRVCEISGINDSRSERLYVDDQTDIKDVLTAYYHLHKRDPSVIEKLEFKLGKGKYTWRDVKRLTDAMYKRNQ